MGWDAVREFDQPAHVTMEKRFDRIASDKETSNQDKAIKMEGVAVDAARNEFRARREDKRNYPEAQRLFYKVLTAHFGLTAGTEVMKAYTTRIQEADKQGQRSSLTEEQTREQFTWPSGEIMKSVATKQDKIAALNDLILQLAGEMHKAGGRYEPEPTRDLYLRVSTCSTICAQRRKDRKHLWICSARYPKR